MLELPLALSTMTREGESGKNALFDSIGPLRCAAGAGTEGEDEEEEDDRAALGAVEALALPKTKFMTDLTGAEFITLLNKLVECVAAPGIGEATCAVDEEEEEEEEEEDDDENDSV
jgi:hypothetical protein